MATSSYDSAYRIGATTFAVPVGVTSNAKYFGVENNLLCSEIQFVSGGTLIAIPVNLGATYAGATLASLGYHHINNANAMEINGPASFYVAALGGTCVVSIQRCYSQGASFFP